MWAVHTLFPLSFECDFALKRMYLRIVTKKRKIFFEYSKKDFALKSSFLSTQKNYFAQKGPKKGF